VIEFNVPPAMAQVVYPKPAMAHIEVVAVRLLTRGWPPTMVNRTGQTPQWSALCHVSYIFVGQEDKISRPRSIPIIDFKLGSRDDCIDGGRRRTIAKGLLHWPGLASN
jgi:hypothetical protein